MIPKKIHYCWFGGKAIPPFSVKCMESWKKFCPDYEIVEWNESNFDVHCCRYVEQAYEAGKWAFVSDVARLYALVNCGGIYLDTDVQITKSLDEFLQGEGFMGFEKETAVSTAVMAAEQNQKVYRELLEEYQNKAFFKPDGSCDFTPNVEQVTKYLVGKGLKTDDSAQTVQGIRVYPHDYFSPKDFVSKKIYQTDRTCAIHHFDGSWMPMRKRIVFAMERYLGNEFVQCLVKVKAAITGMGK